MAILKILQFPDPRLHTIAEPIKNIDAELKAEIADMYETMYHAHGLGLAATQVNIHKRLFVMDCSDTHDQPICAINPEIISATGTQDDYHGCLSVGAGISDKLKRAAKVRLRAMDMDGKTFELDLEGTAAICVQHEIDHLNGKLFINHLSKLKFERVRQKIEKFRRQQQEKK